MEQVEIELSFLYSKIQVNSIFENINCFDGLLALVKLNLFRLKTARKMESHLVAHLALILLYFVL